MDYCTDPLNAWSNHQQRINREELIHFYSLRKEFIIARSPLPPFEPVEKNSLPLNFDYAAYQSECMGDFLTELIELTPPVWIVVWMLALFFICYVMAVGIESIGVPIVWVVLAYVELIFIFVIHQKCTSILKFLVNPAHFRAGKEGFEAFLNDGEREPWEAEKKPTENDPLVKNSENSTEKEKLAKAQIFDENGTLVVDEDNILKSEIEKPAWTLKPGGVVSDDGCCGMAGEAKMVHRQHQLFWFSHLGPDFNIYVLKCHLVLQAIYVAVLFIVFIPDLAKKQNPGAVFLYILFAILPLIIMWVGFYGQLVCNMSHIASTGLLVNKKVVNTVIRKQKTAKALKLVLMLTKLSSFVSDDKEAEEETPYDPKDPNIILQSEEIVDMFNYFDKDHDGSIHESDIDELLSAMGIHLDDQAKAAMLVKLDTDGDGSISREEFVHWQLSHRHRDEEKDLKKTAKKLFKLFDEDGGGTVTVEEFKHELDKLGAGLSIDEVVGLVKEFDIDGDGEISLEEFERVIESAYE